MKLVLFGATGATGTALLGQALAAGHEVTVVVRDPSKLTGAGVEGGAPVVVTGDVLRPGSWERALAGQDAVLSCLGSTDRRNPTTVYSQGAANILSAMAETGVRRLVCISSSGLEIPPGTPVLQRVVTRLVIQRMFRHGYEDMARMEQVLAGSDADWTAVRPPMLTNGPLTREYRVAVDGHVAKPRPLSRSDLAHYLLAAVPDGATFGAAVEIAR